MPLGLEPFFILQVSHSLAGIKSGPADNIASNVQDTKLWIKPRRQALLTGSMLIFFTDWLLQLSYPLNFRFMSYSGWPKTRMTRRGPRTWSGPSSGEIQDQHQVRERFQFIGFYAFVACQDENLSLTYALRQFNSLFSLNFTARTHPQSLRQDRQDQKSIFWRKLCYH